MCLWPSPQVESRETPRWLGCGGWCKTGRTGTSAAQAKDRINSFAAPKLVGADGAGVGSDDS